MKKSILLSIIVLSMGVSIFLGLLGKKEDVSPKRELKTNLMREIITFDPRIADDSDSMQMGFLLYAGLTSLDEEGKIELDLAQDYRVSEDQKTYWFTLKEVNWSDGTPLTAFDFEESWKEYSNERFPASLWEMVSVIKNQRGKKEAKLSEAFGIKALDHKTIEIQLEQPTSYFLQLLAHPTLFPVHHSLRGAFHQQKAIQPCKIVCSGPFKITTYKDQVEIVLEKNREYHNASNIYLDRIHMSRIKDAQTALAMFEKGELDWLGTPLSELPLDALPDLKRKGLLQSHPLLDARFLYFNTKEYPFTNVNLRKALTFAINREALIKDVLQSNDLPALGYIPFAQKKERWHPYFRDHDEESARKHFKLALSELNISEAEFPEIVLAYNTSDTWRRVLQAIQEQWRQVLGIRVKIQNTDWQVHMDRLKRGNYQIARSGRSADFIDPLAFLQPLLSFNEAQNFCRWENREYDNFVVAAEQVKSEADRYEYLEKAEKLLMEEMPVAPLMYFTAYSVARDHVKGVIISPLYYANFSKAYFVEAKNDQEVYYTKN